MGRDDFRFNDITPMTLDAALALVKDTAHTIYDRPEGNACGEAYDAESLIKTTGAADRAISAWRVDLEGGFTVVVGLIQTGALEGLVN